MKRLLLSVVPTLLFASVAPAASPTYINDGVVSVISPPQAAPVIDATNFVNRGYFVVSNLNFFTEPFGTANTYNYTNFNLMFADPGFRFDLFDSVTSSHRMAANFANGVSVLDNNATVYGASKLLIAATNVINRGTLAIDGTGLMKINGHNIDLSHSSVLGAGNETNQVAGFIDRFWGFNNTNQLTAYFSPSEVDSSIMPVEMIENIFTYDQYLTVWMRVALTNGFNAYISVTPGFDTDMIVDAIFLANTNPAISTDVRLGFTTDWGSEKAIQWQSIVTNRFTGGLVTNQIYLIDDLPFWTAPFLYPTPYPVFLYSGLSALTYRPSNYQLTHAYPYFTNMFALAPTQFDPTIFYGTNRPIIVTNAAYGATVTAQAFGPDPYIHGSTYSNMIGRIEIIASNVLSLANTHIDGQSYLRLSSTNHFADNTNSTIFSPFSSLDLGTTNGTLKIQSLTAPTVPRMAGTIDCWSGRWTNANITGSSMYSVLIVDSRLTTETPSEIDELKLRGSNLFISDILNVMNKMLLLCDRLTITTNPPGAPTATGEINLESSQLTWSANMPLLKYMTNYGRISASNSIFFGTTPVAPWSTGSYQSPYNSLVTHGVVAAPGIDAWANYFESSGIIDAGVGPLSIRSVTAFMTNGTVLSPASDVTLSGGSLLISNQVITAGRAINLGFSDYLDDGSLAAGVDYVTNRNFWNVRDGFSLLAAPAHGSLLGTTVTNTAWPNAHILSRWAGADRGCSASGFFDNSALGCLVLDGDRNSLFAFAPVGANNALYVDRLELKNYATSRDGAGNLTGVQVMPGMKIYYAQALADGVSVAEKLNGQNGGAFCWVSSYAGFFSGTNMVYPNGVTYRVNAALVESCDIDSNGNGIVNCLDPAPVDPSVFPVYPPFNPGGGGSTGNTNGTPTTDNGLPKLLFPGSGSGGTGMVASNAFTMAQGYYSGLFYETNGLTASRAGYVTVTTTARKTYSGRVLLGGLSYPFSGTFDTEGRATATINRRSATALTVNLQLDLTGADQITGRVASGTWAADLLANRATFSKAKRSTAAGYYTMLIPSVAGSAPAGFGYGAVNVDALGNVTWSARLADGSVVSQKTMISKDGVWPLYAAPHGGQGVVISWVQFSANDPSGQVIWIKPAGAPGKLFTAGFTNQVQAAISSYTRPAPRHRAIELFNGRGRLVFTGGGLLNAFTNTVQLEPLRALSVAGPKLNWQVNGASGFFQGSVRNPETGKPFVFQGALMQNGNFGAGFFINGDRSGQVYLAEPGAL